MHGHSAPDIQLNADAFSDAIEKAHVKLRKLARIAKRARKRRAAQAIPFLGVIVPARDVRRHRYLRARGLPHSASLAAVLI